MTRNQNPGQAAADHAAITQLLGLDFAAALHATSFLPVPAPRVPVTVHVILRDPAGNGLGHTAVIR